MIHRFVRFVEFAFQTLFNHITNENWMRLITHFEDVLARYMTEAEHRRLKIVDRLECFNDEETSVEHSSPSYLSHIALSSEDDRFETFGREGNLFNLGDLHQTFE